MVRFARNEISSTMIFLSLCNILTSLLEASYSVQESASKKRKKQTKRCYQKKDNHKKIKATLFIRWI